MEPIEALKRREEAAIHWLVDSFSDRLLKAATLILSDQHLAEDAVQDCFVDAIANLESFRGESSAYTWLYTILLRRCYQLRRKNSQQLILSTEVIDGVLTRQGTHSSGPDTEADWVFRNAVKKLKYKYREVIVLFYYAEFSINEIAKLLGAPEGTIKNRLYRARRQLRNVLEKEDGHVFKSAF